MIIINDKYAISSDSNQWVLSRNKAPNQQAPIWRGFKYYGSLPPLISALHDILLRESDYSSFADLKQNARGITHLLDHKLKDAI